MFASQAKKLKGMKKLGPFKDQNTGLGYKNLYILQNNAKLFIILYFSITVPPYLFSKM